MTARRKPTTISYMGYRITLGALYEIAKVTIPTFVDVMNGRVTREKINARCRRFSQGVLDRAGVSLEVNVDDAIDRDRAMIYMSNHQSHVDIPVLFCTVPTRTIRMIAKTELYRIPIWGQALRGAGFVEIDRSNREQAIASMRRAGEQIASGISVWVAPEGSRSSSGEIGKLKKGGFHLARDTGTPIVPVAISGTRKIMPKGSMSMKPNGSVRVIYGTPIEIGDKSMEQLMAEVQQFFHDNVAA